MLFDSIQERDFREAYSEPCVVFCGHSSLRVGDVLYFIQRYKGSEKNALICTNPQYSANASYDSVINTRNRESAAGASGSAAAAAAAAFQARQNRFFNYFFDDVFKSAPAAAVDAPLKMQRHLLPMDMRLSHSEALALVKDINPRKNLILPNTSKI